MIYIDMNWPNVQAVSLAGDSEDVVKAKYERDVIGSWADINIHIKLIG